MACDLRREQLTRAWEYYWEMLHEWDENHRAIPSFGPVGDPGFDAYQDAVDRAAIAAGKVIGAVRALVTATQLHGLK